MPNRNQLTGFCIVRAHPGRYFRTDIIARAFTCWTVADTVVQQSLAQCFNSQIMQTIMQQRLARFFNCRGHDYSRVTGTIVQESLARLFDSRYHDCSTVASMIFRQSLAQFFNSHCHNSSTGTDTILQQWLGRFFNSHGQGFFFFFYAGRTLQQWCSLLKNRAMHQEYDTWSLFFPIIYCLQWENGYWTA